MTKGPTYFGKWWHDEYKSVGDICIVQLDSWYKGLQELPRPTPKYYLIRKQIKNLNILMMIRTSIFYYLAYVSNCYGFGNRPGEKVYFRREVVKLTIIPQDRCINEWGDLAKNDSKICVVNKSGDPCPGDPSTILVCDDPEKHGYINSYHLMGFSATGTVFENHRKKSHSTLQAKRATFTKYGQILVKNDKNGPF